MFLNGRLWSGCDRDHRIVALHITDIPTLTLRMFPESGIIAMNFPRKKRR